MTDAPDPYSTGGRVCEAGNTGYPCLLALLAKGYRVRTEYHTRDDSTPADPSHDIWYWAEADDRSFMAHSAEGLLGLVAMWEVRGDSWRLRPGEYEVVEAIDDQARTFDHNGVELPPDEG